MKWPRFGHHRSQQASTPQALPQPPIAGLGPFALLAQSIHQYTQGHYQNSVHILNQAIEMLPLLSVGEDQELVRATCLVHHALATGNCAQYDTALENLNEAASIFHRYSFASGSVAAEQARHAIYIKLGWTHLTPQQVVSPLAAHSCSSLTAIDDAQSFTEQGHNWRAQHQLAQASKWYNRALIVWSLKPDLIGMAVTLHSLGITLQELGEDKAAVRTLNDSIGTWRLLQEVVEEARSSNALSYILREQGRYAEAIENLSQNIDNLERMRSKSIRSSDPLPSDTETVLQESSSIVELLAHCLKSRGDIQGDIGQINLAVNDLQNASDLSKHSSDYRLRGLCQLSIAVLHRTTAQYEKALEYIEDALHTLERHGYPYDRASLLNEKGIVYQMRGQPLHALECHSDALALLSSSSDNADVGACHHNLGIVYMSLMSHSPGYIELARKHALAANHILTHLSSPQAVNDNRILLGLLCTRQGNVRRALCLYTRAYTFYHQSGLLAHQAVCLNNMGEAYHRLYQTENSCKQTIELLNKALQCHTEALRLNTELENSHQSAISLSNLGYLYEVLGQGIKAEEHYRQALEKFESISEQLQPRHIGQFQHLNHYGVYGRYARLLVGQRRAEEAVLVVERGRAQGLLRQMSIGGFPFEDILSHDDKKAYQEAQTAAYAANLALVALQRQSTGGGSSDLNNNFDHNLNNARQRCRQSELHLGELLDSFYRKYPRFHQGRHAPSLSIEELTELVAANPETLYLEWSVVDDTSLLLLSMSYRSGIIGGQYDISGKNIANLIREWRRTIQEVDETEPDLAQELGSIIWEPLREHNVYAEQFRRVVIIMDGLLLDIPFVAMRDLNGNRLLEVMPDTAITYAPSIKTLLEMQLHQDAEISRQGDHFLIIGDPAPLPDILPPLPYARTEAFRIKELYPQAMLVTGKDATKAYITSHLETCSHLHFAGHGILHPQNGLRSALVLAPPSVGDDDHQSSVTQRTKLTAFDNLLEARELLSKPLAVKFAVLSACHTAQGQLSGGEGLLGLVWTFHAAQCFRILATQWEVKDCATMLLMEHFYKSANAECIIETALALQRSQRLLKEITAGELSDRFYTEWSKSNPSSPWLSTQLETLWTRFAMEREDQRPFHSPRYWAGFCLSGS